MLRRWRCGAGAIPAIVIAASAACSSVLGLDEGTPETQDAADDDVAADGAHASVELGGEDVAPRTVGLQEAGPDMVAPSDEGASSDALGALDAFASPSDETLSDATPSDETLSDATPSDAMHSDAMHSDAALSDATLSDAALSDAMPPDAPGCRTALQTCIVAAECCSRVCTLNLECL